MVEDMRRAMARSFFMARSLPHRAADSHSRGNDTMMSSMRIRDRNWMQIEEYLRHDDRAVLPLGSTEQHAYLSLCVDAILSEAVAVEAAEPLGVPVFPAMPYGPTPSFMAYPGTISLRLQSYLAVVRDVLDSIAAHG